MLFFALNCIEWINRIHSSSKCNLHNIRLFFLYELTVTLSESLSGVVKFSQQKQNWIELTSLFSYCWVNWRVRFQSNGPVEGERLNAFLVVVFCFKSLLTPCDLINLVLSTFTWLILFEINPINEILRK